MKFSSGDIVTTANDVLKGNGALIKAGSKAMVIAIASGADPRIYLLETIDPDFEPEEFFAFEDELERAQEVA